MNIQIVSFFLCVSIGNLETYFFFSIHNWILYMLSGHSALILDESSDWVLFVQIWW